MFKIKDINRQTIDSTTPAVFLLGSAFHKAMEVYYGGSDTVVISNEAEALEYGMKAGMDYIDKFPEGFIKWNEELTAKQQLYDKFSFAFNAYTTERPYIKDRVFSTEEHLKEKIDVMWKGERVHLPVTLEGYTDRIDVEEDGELTVVDYKTVKSFSKPDKIDGNKMIASVFYYFLCYAKHGKPPKKMRFSEVKHTKNSGVNAGQPQVKDYDIVYEENELFFDFFFRLYDDILRWVNGEAVFLPNLDAMFDGDIALIAYIHRLDVEEIQAEKMKLAKVSNITDLLKAEIQNTTSMKMLMQTVNKEFISAKSLDYSKMKTEEKIEMKFMEYGMLMKFDSVVHGNSIDQYRFTPSIGLKMSRVASYVDDIQQVLGTDNIRILTPIPNSTFVGIEVPRQERTFPELPKSEGFNLAIGKTTEGEDFRMDAREMPHALIAGATGAGKSVFLNSLITQLTEADNTEIVLFDPKRVEMKAYSTAKNVVRYATDHIEIALSMIELADEMDKRYNALADANVRNIASYTKEMPYKFIILDEFGDITCGKYKSEVTSALQRIAQLGRACGMHLIIATQRPSVKIISGDIKANFPTKIGFRMSKKTDSQVLLDENGAEKLLGKGDMLFMSEKTEKPIRLQGFNV